MPTDATPPVRSWRLHPAVRHMLLASALFALMNVCVKMVDPRIPAVQIVFFRSIVTLTICVAMLRGRGLLGQPKNRGWLVLRGFAGAGSLLMFFTTLQQIPLATAVTLNFLAPIFTTILAVWLNRERVYTGQWFFFLLPLAGILSIRGFDTELNPTAIVLGVGSSLFAAVAYNAIRRINTTENPLVIVLYFPLVTLPVSGVFTWLLWQQPSLHDWLWILATGILTQLAQTQMTLAYQQGTIARVAIFKYSGIPMALLYGWLIFGEPLTLGTGLGIVLVISGVMLANWYKNRMDRRAAVAGDIGTG